MINHPNKKPTKAIFDLVKFKCKACGLGKDKKIEILVCKGLKLRNLACPKCGETEMEKN